MKTCPQCGERYSDNWDACPNCSGARGPGGSGSYRYTGSGQHTSKKQTRQAGSAGSGVGSDNLGRAVEEFVDDLFGELGNHFSGVEEHLNNLGSGLSDYMEQGAHKGRELRREMRRRRNNIRPPQYGDNRPLEFYEQSWFILLGCILFLPAGAALLLLRMHRTKKYNQWIAGEQYNRNLQQRPAHEDPGRNFDENYDDYRNPSGDAPESSSGAGFADFGSGARMEDGAGTDASGNRRDPGENRWAEPNSGSSKGAFSNGYSGPPVSRNRAFLAMKKSTRNRSIALTVFGVLFSMVTISDLGEGDMEGFLIGLGVSALLLGFGIFPLWRQSRRKKTLAMYESLIDNRGNTRLSYIAQQMGLPVKKVRIQLQKMLTEGFLSEPEHQISAYINGRYDLLVVTHRGQPLIPIEQTIEQEGIRIHSMDQQAAEEQPQEEVILSPEEDLLAVIKQHRKGAAADAVERMESIQSSIQNIILLLEQQPDAYDRNDIKNMRSKYIPGTIDMIEKYSQPSTSPDLKHQIVGMLDTLARAYGNIEDQLRRKVEFDFEIDMEVMRRTLESDGVLGSDFIIS